MTTAEAVREIRNLERTGQIPRAVADRSAAYLVGIDEPGQPDRNEILSVAVDSPLSHPRLFIRSRRHGREVGNSWPFPSR